MAEEKWRNEKLQTAMLLSVQGLTFVSELPEMLLFWVQLTADATKSDPNELSLKLMDTLVELEVTSIGNDVTAWAAARAAVKAANASDESLSERYRRAAGDCESVKLDCDETVSDIENMDQILLPALLGGDTPLSVSHAEKIRELVLRDNDVEATKMLRQCAMKDSSRFALRISRGFHEHLLLDRLRVSKPAELYRAMKTMGCVGPAVFQKDASVVVPQGFDRVSGRSLALRYAMYLDDRMEEAA